MSRPMRFAQKISLVFLSGSLPFLAACAGNAVPSAQASSASTARIAQPQQPAAVAYGQVADPVADPAPVRLASNHPDQYVVQKGDTLWDISTMFLVDPWYWPEIWYLNEQIENPHLIYPGDILNLTWVDGRPRIIVEPGVDRGNAMRVSPQIRYENIDEAITSIPYSAIKSFLSKPSVIPKGQAKTMPYILASKNDHLISGSGNTVYARGFSVEPAVGDVFNVIKIGDELRDPDDNTVIGYDGVYAGEARTTRTGDPVSMVLIETTREVLNGDRLLRDNQTLPLNFFPSAPEKYTEGTIISTLDAISVTGINQIVVINRGSRHGLEPGNLLTILHKGETVHDRFEGGVFAEKVDLPDEPSGMMMLFKIYDRVSYGLVVESTSEIKKYDLVRSP